MPDAVRAHATPVDVELAGGEVLAFGQTRIEVLATPGHTPGSICYLLERNGLRILFSGDTLMTLSAGTGTYAAELSPRHRGDAPAYLASLDKLTSMRAPEMLLPGHPRLDPVPRSPRISPSKWQRLLERSRRELQQLIARHAADGADFLDGQSREILPGLHYLGDLGGRAVYLLATPSHLLLFGAPGGEMLPSWLDSKLRDIGLAPRAVDTVVLTSCESKDVSGLPALVAHSGCSVVAADAGLAIVRPLCPPETDILSAADFEKAGWIDVRALPLADMHPGAMACVVVWDDKEVLFSGRMPIQRGASECRELRSHFGDPANDPGPYRESLDALWREQPQIWLPTVPLHGRNAHLYDKEWDDLLLYNIKFVRHVEEGRQQAVVR
jgi:glyoxylase-like metal-dependent hydrolase (beta-lactamase superfamily II)